MSRFEALLDAFFYRPDEDVGGLLDFAAGSDDLAPPLLEEEPVEYLAFRLESECYAVPILAVREICKVPLLTEIPRAEPHLLGVMNLRGELLPVYDVKLRLRLAEAPPLVAGRTRACRPGPRASSCSRWTTGRGRVGGLGGGRGAAQAVHGGAVARGAARGPRLRGGAGAQGLAALHPVGSGAGARPMTDPVNLLTRRPRGDAPGDAPVAEAEVQLCAFFVGNEEYVLDIMRVEEILPPQRVIPIPHAPAFVEGVLHLRGAMLPVVDLRRRLLGQPAQETRRTRMLVCRLGAR
ncbi:chemotaxis protein CheW, partial [Corallococcus sp. 4LFB]|uniref:chemotaxis protein CheW n=1 Tax=Corallococcus sp. 4LFB TaxID=3383249 RepID=UPI003974BFD0